MDKRAFFRQAGVMLLMAAGLIGERPSQAADSPTVSVLVIYHSATGNTEKMAQGLAEGAKAVSGSSVVLKRVGDVIRDDLLSADAVIVGSPVYAGSISGQVKTFLDNWGPKFGLEARSRNMLNKVGAAFVTGVAETPMVRNSQWLQSLRLAQSANDRHQRRRRIRCERDHGPHIARYQRERTGRRSRLGQARCGSRHACKTGIEQITLM